MSEQAEIETAEELQRAIAELQAKKNELEQREADAENVINAIEMPLATIRLKTSKFNDHEVKGVTPAELTYLVAEHHTRAGGNPILSITPISTTKRDPRHERARLCAKYNKDRVMALFPGTEPTLPKTFRRAMDTGISAKNPNEGFMFKMPLVEANT